MAVERSRSRTRSRYRYGQSGPFPYPDQDAVTEDLGETPCANTSECKAPFALRLCWVAMPTLRILNVTPLTPDYTADPEGTLDHTFLDGAALDMSDIETEEV